MVRHRSGWKEETARRRSENLSVQRWREFRSGSLRAAAARMRPTKKRSEERFFNFSWLPFRRGAGRAALLARVKPKA
jgi:hypothetical protein